MIFINTKHAVRTLGLLAGFCVFTVFADTGNSNNTDGGTQNSVDQESLEENIAEDDEDDCVQEFASEHWVDETQAYAFTGICKTVKWFDGLFGHSRRFNDDQFGGKIVIGFKQREREGFDEKVRIRIKTKLPNLSSRANAFIGRVEETDFVSDGDQNPGSLASTAIRRAGDEDPEWLVGLGYSKQRNKRRGFDFSTGAKISSGLNPFVKFRYRRHFKMPSNHLLRASQTVFWQNDDGYGTTTNLNYSYLAGLNDILEWGSSGKWTEDENQWEWVSGVNWYHRLQNDHAIVSRVYLRGQEEERDSIPEYGVNLVYRRPFLREWLFMEALAEYRWVKEEDDEVREESIGGGLSVIMEFGEVARKRTSQ